MARMFFDKINFGLMGVMKVNKYKNILIVTKITLY